MGSAVSGGGSAMEPSDLAQDSSWSLLIEATLAAPHYQNLATYTRCIHASRKIGSLVAKIQMFLV